MNGQANINILNSKYNNNSFRVDYKCKNFKKTWGDEMNINIEYYKNIKNSGVDYDSRVGYRFTVDLKIQKIKAESVEGTN